MQVAEGIDVEYICEAGSETKILEEAREHVPRIALCGRAHQKLLQVCLLNTHIKDWCYEIYAYKLLVKLVWNDWYECFWHTKRRNHCCYQSAYGRCQEAENNLGGCFVFKVIGDVLYIQLNVNVKQNAHKSTHSEWNDGQPEWTDKEVNSQQRINPFKTHVNTSWRIERETYHKVIA